MEGGKAGGNGDVSDLQRGALVEGAPPKQTNFQVWVFSAAFDGVAKGPGEAEGGSVSRGVLGAALGKGAVCRHGS